MIVSVVRFRSMLSEDEVRATFEDRADRYRQVPGLMQKVYLRFRETGGFGAIYLWASEAALRRFRDSDLARSIPEVYRVESVPSAELADVFLVIESNTARSPVA
jgi:heme-degrading monooxygenase HmoA